jgi:hypothetical protein
LFRKKLQTRTFFDLFEGRCEICCRKVASLEATHLFDIKNEAAFLDAMKADPDNMPFSLNHESNGLLLCSTSHIHLDSMNRVIKIHKTGKIIVKAGNEDENALKLRNRYVIGR